jgi:hypothetical protein
MVRGVRFFMKYEIRSEDFDASRWSSLNPISIAWEVMPYSFVIDWFVNIGGTLRNLETALLERRSKFVNGYWTHLDVVDARYVTPFTRYSAGGGDNWEVDPRTRNWKRIRFERNLLSSYPFPMVPSFRAELGTERLLSAASLLANFLPRR